ncbi:MAG: DUF805 domain-containing protein [Hyphomicrobiales bacterium]|nr:DUF805 domain-containing protein [Hyphomicrobiales bacterium]
MRLSDYLFSPHGRVNRAKYWLYVVVSIAIIIILVALISLIFARQLYDPRGGFNFPPGVLVGVGVVYVVLLVVGIFVGIKRLHDRDKSGWWLLLFYLVPMVLSWISAILSRNGIGVLFALASLIVAVWALVELGFLRGTAGPNQYGEDPLARA